MNTHSDKYPFKSSAVEGASLGASSSNTQQFICINTENMLENRNAENMVEPTKITDLNTHCMQEIFEYLEFNDLLNIADSSKEFYTAACEAYKKRFTGHKLIFDRNPRILFKGVWFYSFLVHWTEITPDKTPEKYFIDISSNPFKVLRNFGHLIPILMISLPGRDGINARFCAEIENYLAMYCSESLQRLNIICNSKNTTFKNLQKPLQKVTYLKIVTLLNQSMDFIQYFNEINLPNVNEIEIDATSKEGLQVVSRNFHFDNVEYLTVRARSNTEYPFSFKNLKHLTLDVVNFFANDAFCECISNFEHLKTLRIIDTINDRFDWASFSKLLKLPNLLSHLEEILFHYHMKLPLNDIFHFLKRSQNLKRLVMFTYNEFEPPFYPPSGWETDKEKVNRVLESEYDQFHVSYNRTITD